MPAAAPTHPSALSRVTRLVAVAAGIGGLLLLGASVPEMIAQAPDFGATWTVLTAGSLAALALALAAAAMRAPVAGLRILLALFALVYLVALASAPWADTAGDDVTPWLFAICPVAGAAAAMPWRATWTWIYLVVVSVLFFGFAATVLPSDPPSHVVFLAAVFGSFYVILISCVALATKRAGRLLDEQTASAVNGARVIARTEAAASERARVEALVHDSILVALLAFARGTPATDARAAHEARHALDTIERFGAPRPEPADVDPLGLVWSIQALATSIAPDAEFGYEVAPARSQSPGIPADVAQALHEATGEALRNSLAHAGSVGVSRAVQVTAASDRVDVIVFDDGRGFGASAVSRARLGVRVSIESRMRQLAGGAASVASTPGRGTVILLQWARP